MHTTLRVTRATLEPRGVPVKAVIQPRSRSEESARCDCGSVGGLRLKLEPRTGDCGGLRSPTTLEALNPPHLRLVGDEPQTALRNRGAEVGLIVFASQSSCPIKEPFQPFDHKAIVVLDKEELDSSALRLACLWARWMARREESEGSEAIDPDRIQTQIDSARMALKAVTTIKGDHTQAKHAIDSASHHLDNLVAEVKAALDHLEAEIAT